MAKRETKVKGGTEAVGLSFFFCAINWRHVKLHGSSDLRHVSDHTGPRRDRPLHDMLFRCVCVCFFSLE